MHRMPEKGIILAAFFYRVLQNAYVFTPSGSGTPFSMPHRKTGLNSSCSLLGAEQNAPGCPLGAVSAIGGRTSRKCCEGLRGPTAAGDSNRLTTAFTKWWAIETKRLDLESRS